MTNITLTELAPGLIHLDFLTKIQMNKALMRPQEFAENPKLKGVVASSRRIQRYYKSFFGNGRWDYHKAILGCNIPGHCFDYLKDGRAKPTASEQEVLDLLAPYEGKFYVIASADSDHKANTNDALEHEIAHGTFYLDEEYREVVISEIVSNPHYKKLWNAVKRMGYHDDVVIDEINAYIVTDTIPDLRYRFRNMSEEELKSIETFYRARLTQLFEEHRKDKKNE